MLGTDPAPAQQPTIFARQAAAHGPTDSTVTEPAIAAGGNRVISVFFDFDNRPRYAAYDLSAPQGGWVEGIIDPGTAFTDFWDLSIAYDVWHDRFVAAAFADKPVNGVPHRHIVTSRTGDPTDPYPWEPWVSQLALPAEEVPLDKPWIVAGEMTSAVQEFYIVYWRPPGESYGYLRSIDGGDCWAADEIRFADTQQPVTGTFCAQAAVHDDGPLYVAYVVDPNGAPPAIRFVVGTDIDPADPNNYDCTDPAQVGVSFAALQLPVIPPAQVSVPLNRRSFDSALPGVSPNNFEAKLVPWVAVDPNDGDRLYIVYHDVEAPDSNDVNVYLHELNRSGNYWQLSTRRQVNNDDDPFVETDQFMPAVTVDGIGRIHVIFYDDRNRDQDDGEPEPQFDVFYAWSEDQGETWENEELWADPVEPAIDFQYGAAWMREYIGIAWDRNRVWTAFNGTSLGEVPDNKGLIWSSLIGW